MGDNLHDATLAVFWRPTLMPCILDIALSGLRALRVLIVRKAWMPPAPSREAVKFIRDTWVSGLVG